MKNNSLLIILSIITISSQKICPQDQSQTLQYKSVIIMPFVSEERYPYGVDEIRDALINGFLRRNFNVINDEQTWSKVLKFDYSLYDINNEMADSISTVANADLIVYGRVDRNSGKFRNAGLYKSYYSPTPLLIKVFDPMKKNLVLYERMEFTQREGLFTVNLDLTDIADRILIKLIQLGY